MFDRWNEQAALPIGSGLRGESFNDGINNAAAAAYAVERSFKLLFSVYENDTCQAY